MTARTTTTTIVMAVSSARLGHSTRPSSVRTSRRYRRIRSIMGRPVRAAAGLAAGRTACRSFLMKSVSRATNSLQNKKRLKAGTHYMGGLSQLSKALTTCLRTALASMYEHLFGHGPPRHLCPHSSVRNRARETRGPRASHTAGGDRLSSQTGYPPRSLVRGIP